VAALGTIRDPRAVALLIAALKDSDVEVRKSAANALRSKNDPSATAALLTALEDRDLAAIGGAHIFYIQWGEPNSEDGLMEALNAGGDAKMAFNFIVSENSKLASAGREWAMAHHTATDPPQPFSSHFVWGHSQEWHPRFGMFDP